MRLRYEKVMTSSIYKDPLKRINDKYLLIDSYLKRLENNGILKLNEVKTEFVKQATLLDSLSPLKTLTRGYSLVEKEGKVVSSVEELHKGDKVSLRLQNGTKNAVID